MQDGPSLYERKNKNFISNVNTNLKPGGRINRNTIGSNLEEPYGYQMKTF